MKKTRLAALQSLAVFVAIILAANRSTGASVQGAESVPVSREETLRRTLERFPQPADVFRPAPTDFRLHGEERGRLSPLPGDTPAAAMQFETLATGENEWDVQVGVPVAIAAEKDDVLLARFLVRNPQAADGADALTELVIERGEAPYDKCVTYPVRTTGDWTLHYVPFRSPARYLAGEWNLNFRGGYRIQRLQIADVQVLNFARSVPIGDMPRIAHDWPGRAPDAPWRAEAARRIERIRKADLAVTVLDAHGTPIPGAKVRVEMTRHAFLFGSAVNLHWIADGDNPEREIYRKHIEALFNHVVSENDLKWPRWDRDGKPGPYSRAAALAGLDWLRERRIHVKGHCIIWPSWKHVGEALRKVRDDPAAMRLVIAEHIRDLVTTAGPQVDEWDVINEPFNNNDVMKILGDEEMIGWFRQAHEHDPSARLYLNDFGILAAGGMTDTPHQRHFEETLRFLVKGGAPISGIGMQSHFGENVTPPEALWQILDRYAALGLPIQITEFDVNSSDESLQADYQSDFMTAIFAHEAVNGFVMWGFYEGAHWRPDAALFRKDWSIKPNGEAYRRLVFDEWWTREIVATDAAGKANVRGFLGEYRVTVTHDGRETSQTVVLERGGSAMQVRLP